MCFWATNAVVLPNFSAKVTNRKKGGGRSLGKFVLTYNTGQIYVVKYQGLYSSMADLEK